MKTIKITKGLDIPIAGKPVQEIAQSNAVRKVGLIGDDYPGLKPTMLVNEGDQVKTGQPLFTDKRNEGVIFTSPGCGTVVEINRGAKRKFESIGIALEGEEVVTFCEPVDSVDHLAPDDIRKLLISSGLWTSVRTRPYGKIPPIAASPASLFITAIDTEPLAAKPTLIMERSAESYTLGLKVLRRMLDVAIHYCLASRNLRSFEEVDGISYCAFAGPHPAGLASTHIHFIDPAHESKSVWQIGYQDVISIGKLFSTGQLPCEKVIALSGTGVMHPRLIATRPGAFLPDLCRRELKLDELRVISGSPLSGREAKEPHNFLGRYHNQVAVIENNSGRSFFNWLLPGKDRFSIKPVFASAFLDPDQTFNLSTALWGGKRAIYPLGTYEQVMPMDIIATSLLKSLAKGDTEKSKALGCLELIEEDLALCSFVCPGKNEFGPDLRAVLTAIEQGN
jgi:Na+-transporting NADH:ubiquinone oxidoreductase subunit A